MDKTVKTSLPLRECGLKLDGGVAVLTVHVSLPLRECGLKLSGHHTLAMSGSVTPLAGVWIEMPVAAESAQG